MPTNSDSEGRLLDLASRFLDGELSEDELRRLGEIVRENPAAQNIVARLVSQHGALRWTRVDPAVVSAFKTPKQSASRWMIWASAAAAALLISIAAVVAALRRSPEPPVATAPKEVPAPRIEQRPEIPPPPPLPAAPPLPPETPRDPVVVPKPPPEPVPPPAPQPPPAPLPAPKKEDATPPPPRPSTRAIVCEIERVEGKVFVVTAEGRTPALPRRPLRSDEGVAGVGWGARATLAFPDQTRLDIAGDTVVEGISDEQGRSVRLTAGLLSARADTLPLAVTTPQGRIEATGARISVWAEPEGPTWLDVGEGRAKFTRARDGASVVVPKGSYAVIAEGIKFAAVPVHQDDRIDPFKVDQVIKKGVAFLKQAEQPDGDGESLDGNSEELILWTFVHAAVPESDPRFQQLLQRMLSKEPAHTYQVALQAMILEELDRVKHQARIAHCAQFLVDNQCRNGQWGYGKPTAAPRNAPASGKDVATPSKFDAAGKRVKPKVAGQVKITRARDGEDDGDNSNSQYAALGLRACAEAGIVVPRETLERAAQWWRENQVVDRKNPYASGGWTYKTAKDLSPQGIPYPTSSAMTAGAVGSLLIYDRILKVDWKRDPAVNGGMTWLANNFTVGENLFVPKVADEILQKTEGAAEWLSLYHYYYLYALERAGIFAGLDKLGRTKWYPAGARVILDAQSPEGSWPQTAGGAKPSIVNTCFAILFLKRATRPLDDVPTIDRIRSTK